LIAIKKIISMEGDLDKQGERKLTTFPKNAGNSDPSQQACRPIFISGNLGSFDMADDSDPAPPKKKNRGAGRSCNHF
jgi:hypothetical protein